MLDRRTLLKGMAIFPAAGPMLGNPIPGPLSGPGRTEQGQPALASPFSAATRWIWDSTGEYRTWWMFRKTMELPHGGIESATLRITSCQSHIAYVNGHLMDRGPALSYDFAKHYREINVTPLLVPGQRCAVAILSLEVRQPDSPPERPTQGLLVELTLQPSAGAPIHLVSDRTWKVKRHPSFREDVSGEINYLPMQGPEEWFDARNEPVGWTLPDYDDSSWPFARELGSPGIAPWIGFEKHWVAPLTHDLKYPVRFVAMELATPRPGYLFRLLAPFEGPALFAARMACSGQASLKITILTKQTKVSIDGSLIDSGRPVRLAPGNHLICCLAQAVRPEILLETAESLQFSTHEFPGGKSSEWVALPVMLKSDPPRRFEFPWNGNPWDESENSQNDLLSRQEVLALLSIKEAKAFPNEVLADFRPARRLTPGVMEQVTTQIFLKPAGGFTEPAIEVREKREKTQERLQMSDFANLLHDNDSFCTIAPPGGKDVHFIVDFDCEMIGYLRLRLDAPAGTIIDVQGFELIDGDGIAWMPNRNGFRYVCREGLQDFVSHYRRGFRYASVTLRNFHRPVRFYNISCHYTTYPVQRAGHFECSDELLNTIFGMAANTAALCMLDNYVDCPGHEQAFWVGDARITALINLTLFGAYDLNQSCLRIVGQSLQPEWVQEYFPKDPRYLSSHYLPIAAFPNYPEGGLPLWSFLWILQCWDHYLYGANLEDLRHNFDSVTATLENCRRLTNDRGLFDMPGAWNLIEWGNNDLSVYGEVTASNAMLARCLRVAAKMAGELGEPDKASEFEQEASRRISAINKLCWDNQRNAYVDTVRDEWAYQRYVEWSQSLDRKPVSLQKYLSYKRVSEQTNTLALICDCVPSTRRQSVQKMVERVKHGHYVAGSPGGRTAGLPGEAEAPEGIVAVGSPFFLFFTLEALFQNGMAEIALQVMRRDWGAMAASGTKTCWETFKSNDRNWTRSVCHGWSAAPAVYLPQQVLGIRPIEPGYRKFVIEPCPARLEWARGSVVTPYGPIFVSWRRDDTGKRQITCSAPSQCQRLESAGTF